MAMDMDFATRLEKLEADVSQLKKLATLDRRIEEVRAKSDMSSAKPKRKMGFAAKFLIFLGLLAVAVYLTLPFITAAITAKFSSIGASISTGN
jgi:hypothetical protein